MGDMFGCGYDRSYQEGQGKTLIIWLRPTSIRHKILASYCLDSPCAAKADPTCWHTGIKILYYRLSEVSGTKKLAADPLKPVICITHNARWYFHLRICFVMLMLANLASSCYTLKQRLCAGCRDLNQVISQGMHNRDEKLLPLISWQWDYCLMIELITRSNAAFIDFNEHSLHAALIKTCVEPHYGCS